MTTTVEPAAQVQKRRRLPPELLWGAVAVGAFQVAYLVPQLALLMVVYLYGLVRLTEATSARRAFYSGFAVGMACFVPQLWFFTGIFHFAALALWAVGAIWIGFFVLIGWGLRQVTGIRRWAWMLALPVVWMGLEYFRSELYYLKFAWLTPGIAMGADNLDSGRLVGAMGVYGTGFVLTAVAATWTTRRWRGFFVTAAIIAMLIAILMPSLGESRARAQKLSLVVGVQLENPSAREVLDGLDSAVSAHPDAALLVMSEYALSGPPSETLKEWCRRHERYLVIGGKQPLPPLASGVERYADTAFVIDPKGDVVFSQGKSVPIQFFEDGVPANEQRLWDSPWGKVGICICYDLSYTRVTDELVRQGAQLLIVPAMDAEEWGAQEHALHARIAPVRALEYGVPIVRVASSGISQIIRANGTEIARTSFPGRGELLAGKILGYRGPDPHLPPDRYLAPVCVVLTGLIAVWLVGRKAAQRLWNWRKDRWKRQFPGLRG